MMKGAQVRVWKELTTSDFLLISTEYLCLMCGILQLLYVSNPGK